MSEIAITFFTKFIFIITLFIIILYKKVNYDILDIIHIKSDDITCNNIIPRKPLSNNAKRAGWQGCHLHFTNIRFMTSEF